MASIARCHFGKTGKERDPESASVAQPQGLDDFGARFDSSAMGRFMSPDWANKPEPVPYAKMGNPQTFNLYAFAQNNPESAPDLDGHYRRIPVCDFFCEEGMAEYAAQQEADAAAAANTQPSSTASPQVQSGAPPQNGSSLPSSLAMATGSSIGGIFSTVKKLFGFGKDTKDIIDAKEQFSFWSKMHVNHIKVLKRDMSNSKYANPMHIEVDHAQIALDEAEMNYYSSKGMLTVGGASGGIMLPQLGDGALSLLQMQVDAASQHLADVTAAYNNDVGAVFIQNPN